MPILWQERYHKNKIKNVVFCNRIYLNHFETSLKRQNTIGSWKRIKETGPPDFPCYSCYSVTVQKDNIATFVNQ